MSPHASSIMPTITRGILNAAAICEHTHVTRSREDMFSAACLFHFCKSIAAIGNKVIQRTKLLQSFIA
jgi:hypothetical protein